MILTTIVPFFHEFTTNTELSKGKTIFNTQKIIHEWIYIILKYST